MRRISAVALSLLAGCSAAGGDASSPVTVRDSAGIVVVTNDLARLTAACAVDSVPTTLIGVAEGAPEYMLHRVFGAAQLNDGRIVVVNQGSNELRYYDRDGKFLMRAGREGQGPGEFSNAFYIWPTRGDTVYVGDYRPWQFLVFDQNGAWVRTARPKPDYINPPEVLGVLQDGTMVLSQEPPDSRDPRFHMKEITIVLHSADGALIKTLDTLPNGRWGQTGSQNSVWLYPWFESFAEVTASGSRIAFGHGATPELRIRDLRDGMAVSRIIRWTTTDRRITDADVKAAKERMQAEYSDLDGEMRARLLEPLISDARPVADQLPAFANAMFGRDGRLWVREYHRPEAPDVEEWIGFDSTGSYACRFSIPASQELLEIGADYLLTKDPDADGVERIARFALAKAGSQGDR
jgi:hypothetical protein